MSSTLKPDPLAARWGELPREPFRAYTLAVDPVCGRTDGLGRRSLGEGGSSGASPHRRLLGLLAWPILVLALAGCSTAVPYERPEVAVPEDWRWKTAEPRDQAPRGEWWKVFEDPALDNLQAEAAGHNQDLKAALARVEQARAIARMSRADLFPTLNGSANWVRYRTSGNSPSPVPFPIPSFTQEQWSTPLDLSYEINLWGRVRGSFESARQQALAAESARQALLLIIQADVTAGYFNLQSLQIEVDVFAQTVRLRRDAMEVFDQRAGAGLIGDYEIQRGRVEVAVAEAELEAAKQRQAVAWNALAVLCGSAPAAFTPVTSTNLSRPQVAPELPSSLLERRPDVAAAERELAARLAQIGVAKAAFYPSIRLTGTAGYLSGELTDLFAWDSRTWSIGPSISIPLFQGGRIRADQAQAMAAYEESVALFQQKVLVAFREVEDSLAALQFLAGEVEARQRAAVAALQSARIAFARYQAGTINFLDVVNAENVRLVSELARVRVEHEQRLATVRLIKALGGGWQ